MQIERKKGIVDYPCQWSYRVIGKDLDDVRHAVESILGGREFLLHSAKGSSGGKYHSWQLDLEVRDEEERNGIFVQIKCLPQVIMVI